MVSSHLDKIDNNFHNLCILLFESIYNWDIVVMKSPPWSFKETLGDGAVILKSIAESGHASCFTYGSA